MHYNRDKDLAWVITFTSLLVFLLGAIASAAIEATPSELPQAVVLAHANLSREFVSALSSFIRYVAVAGLIYGIVAIITWPPGPS
jgi:hypothetical protein